MLRISYHIEGMRYEEIINPNLTPITDEMLDNIECIYDFLHRKSFNGPQAREYAEQVIASRLL